MGGKKDFIFKLDLYFKIIFNLNDSELISYKKAKLINID